MTTTTQLYGNYSNDTQYDDTGEDNWFPQQYPLHVTVLLALLLSAITVATIVLSVGAAAIFFAHSGLRTFSDRLILNLCVADALVAVLSMPVQVTLALTGDVWLWSQRGCLLFMTVETVVNYVSVIATLVVSLNQYLMVTRRARYWSRQHLPLLLVMVVTPWLAIFAFFGVPILAYHRDFPPLVCSTPFEFRPYIALVVLISPFVPIIAVPVLDFLIYFSIRSQYSKKVKAVRDRLVASKKEEARATGAAAGKAVAASAIALTVVKEEDDAKALSESESSMSQSGDSSISVTEESAWVHDASSNALESKPNEAEGEVKGEEEAEGKGKGEKKEENKEAEGKGEEEAAEGEGKGEKEEENKEADAVSEYASDLKEARLSLVLGMVLVVCCTPFESLKLVSTLCSLFPQHGCLLHIPAVILSGARWSVLLNSTFNPVLYFALDQRYREAFCHYWRRIRCRG